MRMCFIAVTVTEHLSISKQLLLRQTRESLPYQDFPTQVNQLFQSQTHAVSHLFIYARQPT